MLPFIERAWVYRQLSRPRGCGRSWRWQAKRRPRPSPTAVRAPATAWCRRPGGVLNLRPQRSLSRLDDV